MNAIKPVITATATFTEAATAGHSAPRPGEPFNPWRGVCGFYPPDCVSRLRQVFILKTRHKLTDGHKCLYTLLVRRWGQKGPCFPGQESLAADLGRSVREVKVWIGDLEAFGLIRYRRRGRGNGKRGLTNEYTFLWHRIFEVQSPPKARFSKCDYGRFEVRKSAVLKCEDQHALYKEETRTKEACADGNSSSSVVTGRLIEFPSNEPATTKVPLSENKNNENTPWWTPEDLKNAKDALAKHRTPLYSYFGGPIPDSSLVAQVLRHFSDLAEFIAWLEELTKRFPGKKVQSWGFYEHDARCQWPERRAEVEAKLAAATRNRAQMQAEEERTKREREREQRQREELISKCRAKGWKRYKDLNCKRCAGYGREPDTEQTCDCKAGKQFEHESTKCPRCDHSGIIDLSEDSLALVEWCDCQHAIARKKDEPDHVEKRNAVTSALRSKIKSQKPAEPQPPVLRGILRSLLTE
jgi:hypothetical protein